MVVILQTFRIGLLNMSVTAKDTVPSTLKVCSAFVNSFPNVSFFLCNPYSNNRIF